MNYTILFSGQGAQKSGMGVDFLEDPLFAQTIDLASKASKKDIIKIFKSENDELNQTINVQPALVAYELGIYRMLKRDCPNLEIKSMIGLSLGEYSAMAASHALSIEDSLSLVSDRAEYMQEDADKIDNSMAALINPDMDKVRDILSKLQNEDEQVYLANFNSPKQVVLAGEKEAVAQAVKLIEEDEAAKRAILLKVNGAFHTPLFNNAGQKMHKRLKDFSFKQNDVPVISNTTAEPFNNDWAAIMEKQLAVPTHFGECVDYTITNNGVNASLEIGPGKVLSRFVKQIDRSISTSHIGNLEEYKKFIEEVNGTKG